MTTENTPSPSGETKCRECGSTKDDMIHSTDIAPVGLPLGDGHRVHHFEAQSAPKAEDRSGETNEKGGEPIAECEVCGCRDYKFDTVMGPGCCLHGAKAHLCMALVGVERPSAADSYLGDVAICEARMPCRDHPAPTPETRADALVYVCPDCRADPLLAAGGCTSTPEMAAEHVERTSHGWPTYQPRPRMALIANAVPVADLRSEPKAEQGEVERASRRRS
jgi:hypothetical protein